MLTIIGLLRTLGEKTGEVASMFSSYEFKKIPMLTNKKYLENGYFRLQRDNNQLGKLVFVSHCASHLTLMCYSKALAITRFTRRVRNENSLCSEGIPSIFSYPS
jgi:hypothetical protein